MVEEIDEERKPSSSSPESAFTSSSSELLLFVSLVVWESSEDVLNDCLNELMS